MHNAAEARVIIGLHYAVCASPVAALLTTLITRNSTRAGKQRPYHHDATLTGVQTLVVVINVVEIVLVVLSNDRTAPLYQAHLVHLVLTALTWSSLAALRNNSSVPLVATSSINVSFELPLVACSSIRKSWTSLNIASFATQIARIVLLLSLLLLALRHNHPGHSVQDDDTQPLLQDQEDASCDYGGITGPNNNSSVDNDSDSDTGSDSEDEDNVKVKQRRAELLKDRGGWLAYLRDFKIFLPYIVPKHDRKIQFCYLVCILCLGAGRILNILLPTQLGKVVDNLLDREPPYRALALWLLLSFARYDPGLDFIQALVKIPIENFSYRGLTNAAFSHIMSLSMDFHTTRDSAEVIAAVEQGQAITNLLSTFMLEIVPTCLDLVVALVYLSCKFDSSVAIALSVAMIVIISAEAIGLSWNLDRRRKMSKTSRQQATVILQAVQGWQTVSFFNMFNYERHRFGRAVQDQLAAKQSWALWDAATESILGSLIPTTFFILACLVMHEISLGRATPGDFVFLMQYWDYLTWPVSMLSHNCKFLMSDFVDAERLLHLMQIQPSIKTHENAIDINVKGRVAFDRVEFSYDPKQATLRDLSFEVSPGQTIALVGETGAGKSSIMKLLLRLYDVTGGRILIDGHDIRNLTLDSLRSAIGVVPQAPLLFNGTVLENLRYARLDATDAEVQEACRAAAIHDKILTFTDGYNTKVGEQGVKLSGGEVQRLAIARVFLKDPPILILDEATSAVDSITEATVQAALDRLRTGRTTLVIAHRLSTIVKADQILVIHDGRIDERGRHQELLQLDGRYSRMWQVQIGASGK
jgi:ABC-type multidrug transport system fused ATPase/permease subunit